MKITMKNNGLTLGVLGGMGPAASAEFMRLLAVKAPADCDQEHPRVILYSNSITPDRTSYIVGKGEDPEPYLHEGLDTLIKWGADRVCVTCNTAHFFVDKFRDKLAKPLIHIIDETIRTCQERSPEGAWLTATIGTMDTGIYQKHAADCGYNFMCPSREMQLEIHDIITHVKAGELESSGKRFKQVCEELWKIRKAPIVGACTEIPIAYQYAGLPEELGISSLEALADGCIRELYKKL